MPGEEGDPPELARRLAAEAASAAMPPSDPMSLSKEAMNQQISAQQRVVRELQSHILELTRHEIAPPIVEPDLVLPDHSTARIEALQDQVERAERNQNHEHEVRAMTEQWLEDARNAKAEEEQMHHEIVASLENDLSQGRTHAAAREATHLEECDMLRHENLRLESQVIAMKHQLTKLSSVCSLHSSDCTCCCTLAAYIVWLRIRTARSIAACRRIIMAAHTAAHRLRTFSRICVSNSVSNSLSHLSRRAQGLMPSTPHRHSSKMTQSQLLRRS